MHFTTLRLKQFRNYPYLELEPSEGITVLYGPNGSGNFFRWAGATAPPPTGKWWRRGKRPLWCTGRPAVWMDGTRSKFA